jgi:predicted nucleic-acid-binding protein
MAGGQAWVCHVVLVETVRVLESVYRRSRAQIADAVATLLDHEALVVDEAPVVAAALLLFRRRGSVGFSDCLVLETARNAGHLPLGTFDRGLAALGAEQL